MSGNPDECPHSQSIMEFSELRQCAVWGMCGRRGYTQYLQCPTYMRTVKQAEGQVT